MKIIIHQLSGKECKYLQQLPNTIDRSSNLIAGSYCFFKCQHKIKIKQFVKGEKSYYEVDCKYIEPLNDLLNNINRGMI